ncbi:MAG: hypothetical protein QW808_00750 [Desulfurococcaceae archaeon]
MKLLLYSFPLGQAKRLEVYNTFNYIYIRFRSAIKRYTVEIFPTCLLVCEELEPEVRKIIDEHVARWDNALDEVRNSGLSTDGLEMKLYILEIVPNTELMSFIRDALVDELNSICVQISSVKTARMLSGLVEHFETYIRKCQGFGVMDIRVKALEDIMVSYLEGLIGFAELKRRVSELALDIVRSTNATSLQPETGNTTESDIVTDTDNA